MVLAIVTPITQQFNNRLVVNRGFRLGVNQRLVKRLPAVFSVRFDLTEPLK